MNEQLRKAIEEATRVDFIDFGGSVRKDDHLESKAKLLRVIELLVEQRKANLNSQLLASQAGYSYTIDGLIDYLDAELIAALEGK